jgi:hypothetical protein
MKKVSDDVLIESYNRLKNVWKVGKEVGLCGQSVHERLVKLKSIVKGKENRIYDNSLNKFKDYDILKEKYEQYVSEGRLQELANELGRTKQFLCRKAKEIGLTNMSREKILTDSRIEANKNRWKKREHPRGMLGKTHSDEEKLRMSKRFKDQWANYTEKEKYELLKKRANTRKPASERKKVTWKGQWQTVGSFKHYFRSEWEYIYALYLQYQLEHKKIVNWEPEPHRFLFDNGSKVSSYLPDFRITHKDGTQEYHEVKGWFDQRSIDVLFQMSFYYPDVKIVIIDVKWFKKNKLKFKKCGYEKEFKL